MNEILIYLDDNSPLSLQAQIREKFIEAILSGALPEGQRLPSSRKLAQTLGVSRNTIILAYQHLIGEGYLESKERSGLYVSKMISIEDLDHKSATQLSLGQQPSQCINGNKNKLIDKCHVEFKHSPSTNEQYSYNFIHNQIDTTLIPTASWQEASRLAHSHNAASKWKDTDFDADDPELIDQIRTKILVKRGITAAPDEIILTAGAHNAHFLVTQLLINKPTHVAFEEPGDPATRDILSSTQAILHYQPVDEAGIVVNDCLNSCQIIYSTPSHQVPTGVCMTLKRRQALIAKANAENITIVEDDVDSDSNYEGQKLPALRSIDTQGRVIYLSQLSDIIAPGISLGFIVASSNTIDKLKKIRCKMMPPPSLVSQRMACIFMKLGYYNASLSNISKVLHQRWEALWKALNYHMPFLVITAPSLGGACWVKNKKDIDIRALVSVAKNNGILIEAGNRYYSDNSNPERCFRIGVAGAPIDRIRPGVSLLADIMRDLTSDDQITLDRTFSNLVSADKLFDTLAGATLKMKTVFGGACSIQLHPDGTMSGHAVLNDERHDKGTWWTEGNLWYRKWDNWSYGEVLGLKIVIKGNTIRWYNACNQLEDHGQIIFAND